MDFLQLRKKTSNTWPSSFFCLRKNTMLNFQDHSINASKALSHAVLKVTRFSVWLRVVQWYSQIMVPFSTQQGLPKGFWWEKDDSNCLEALFVRKATYRLLFQMLTKLLQNTQNTRLMSFWPEVKGLSSTALFTCTCSPTLSVIVLYVSSYRFSLHSRILSVILLIKEKK